MPAQRGWVTFDGLLLRKALTEERCYQSQVEVVILPAAEHAAREDELAQLRQWKKEAIEVDRQWDEVREHLRTTYPMKIGQSYSNIALDLLKKDSAREAVIQAAREHSDVKSFSTLYELREALDALEDAELATS